MRKSSAQRRLVLTVSALALAAGAPGVAPAATYSWIGGTGLYTVPAFWTPVGTPGSGDDAQVYAAGSNVELFGINQSVGTMELGAGAGSGRPADDQQQQFHSRWRARSRTTASLPYRIIRGSTARSPLDISGTGTIVLDDTAGYARLFENGGYMTLGAGQTVRGSGAIGLNNPAITNNGLISADVNGRTIDIDPAAGNGGIGGGLGASGAASFLNAGTMQATGGGNLQLEGGFSTTPPA